MVAINNRKYYVTVGATGVFYVIRVKFKEKIGTYIADRDHFVKKLTTDKITSIAIVNEWMKENNLNVSMEGMPEETFNNFTRRTQKEMEIERETNAEEKYKFMKGKIPFGKWAGATFNEVMEQDIHYVDWMSKNFEPKDYKKDDEYMNVTNRKLAYEFKEFLDWFKDNVCMVEDKFKNKDSEFIGTVGEKIEVKVKVKKIVNIETCYGMSRLLIFTDDNGNKITSFYSGKKRFEENVIYNISGTVKKHDIYKNEKQTVLYRIKTL